jgi:glyoxylase I family protein
MTKNLHHLAFRTSDVAALVSFYREMLGLEVVRESLPRSVWLALGHGAVLMIERRDDDETPVATGSNELIAFAAADDVREAVRQNALASDCYDGETELTVYLRDPDGRRIGVSSYRFDAAAS